MKQKWMLKKTKKMYHLAFLLNWAIIIAKNKQNIKTNLLLNLELLV